MSEKAEQEKKAEKRAEKLKKAEKRAEKLKKQRESLAKEMLLESKRLKKIIYSQGKK